MTSKERADAGVARYEMLVTNKITCESGVAGNDIRMNTKRALVGG